MTAVSEPPASLPLPQRMRAALVREHGSYDKVLVEELPRPVPLEGHDVVLRVRACALNRMDLFLREGIRGPGIRTAHLPHVSGGDVAGEIAEVGPGVDGWKPGDRAVIYPGLSCGQCEWCTQGEESMCTTYRILGEDVHGGLAEYCRVDARNLERLPDGLGFEQAAALPAAYTTAWRMIVTAGQLAPHERVLVLGAGGGVGCAAVQLAKRIGAHVFAVTSGTERASRLAAIGADRPIDRLVDDFESVVAAETRGRGVDLVVNPVGGTTWPPAIRSLAMGGRMLICGATIGDNPDFSMRELYQSHRQIKGAPIGNRRDFRAVLDLVARGEIEPVIDRVLPLEETAEAHRALEAGEIFGKVVIAP